MGDERAAWESDEAVEVESQEGDDLPPRPARGSFETPDVLKIRWETPRGRKIRALVIRAIRFEQSAGLAEILQELRGASEVPGFLDLRYVRLDGENLSGTNLEKVDLTGASLAKTTLVGASLREAKLVKARLVGAPMREADLSGADLSDANLTEACLDQVAAISATFARARMIAASMRQASLVNADLRGAMLVRAVFDEADLGGARVEGAHALPRAFERAGTKPENLAAVLEVPISGAATPSNGTRRLDAARLDTARLELAKMRPTQTGFIRERIETAINPAPVLPPTVPGPALEKRPTSKIHLPPVGLEMPKPEVDPWDQAIANLITQRGKVSRVVITIDGAEKVIFGR